MPNHTDRKRYMVKFLFNRMGEPTAPSWDNDDAEWGDDDGEHKGLLSHAWDWFRADSNGLNGGNDGSIDDLIADLCGDSESAAFDAAYTLSAMGDPAVGPLIDTMRAGSADNWYNDKDRLRRIPGQMEQAANASYALTAMGTPAVPALVDSMATSEEWDKALAAETLGDIGLGARGRYSSTHGSEPGQPPLRTKPGGRGTGSGCAGHVRCRPCPHRRAIR